MKKALIIAAILALTFGANAGATTITLSSIGVVGMLDMNRANENANPATRQSYANHLLAMIANSIDGVFAPPGQPAVYYTGPTEYSGSVDLGYKMDGSTTGYAGYTYLLAKYDGPNAGYILWYIPAIGSSIPASVNVPGLWDSAYGLSGWTAFNVAVPDGGSVAMLLGAALVGLAGFRRMLK